MIPLTSLAWQEVEGEDGVVRKVPMVPSWGMVLEYLIKRSLFRYVFDDVKQCLTTALFTARADGRSESLPPLDFCKACLWQVMDASIDLRDPNPN